MSEKPLSGKKLRRMLRKQQAAEKNANVGHLEMSKEWDKPPKHLKGKEIGLWHKEKARRLKQLKKGSESSEAETKMSKKERRALKLQRKEESELHGKCYKIDLDPTRQQLIKEYLSAASESPPSFLLPQYEYHKKIKRVCREPSTAAVESANCDPVVKSEPQLNVDEFFTKSKELLEKFPIKPGEDLSVSFIKKFLEKEEMYDQNLTQGSQSAASFPSSSDSEKQSTMIDEDGGTLDSLDKYKHLADTTFKRNFMDILSQDIQSKLEKAMGHNMAVKKNKKLDKEYLADFKMKGNIPRYRTMQQARHKLPACKMQREILHLINNNRVCLISGETGCGKTTQVAQFILDEAIMNECGSTCNILCTQPRRISAISVAHRVAEERAESVGRESIGYQIRLEKKIGRPRGSILFCTTGILLQYMQSDPALKKYSHIILDEIHERDIMCDFVLTILRDVVAKRSDLKIVLMSATLNADQFSAYFYNCPSINIPGYTYPVEEYYLEDVLLLTKFEFSKNAKRKGRDFEDDESFKSHIVPYANNLKRAKKYPDFVIEGLMNPDSERVNADLIAALVQYICQCHGPGAILIFVPGWEDITATTKKLSDNTKFPSSRFLIIPLHSMLPTAAQQSVFDRPPHGTRKIVVATNIAETSITIDDIVFVIDCGKIKIKNYDVVNNISTLKPEFVSLANARQRRGRAGRVQNGFCFHLFSRAREQLLADYPLPEMLRTRLEEVILNIKLLQLGKAGPFLSKVLDPPNAKTVLLALELLRQLNALDENENLTPLGFHLAKLPLDPQIGKMLLMGVTMSCLSPILSIAATLSFKDPFFLPMGEEKILKERKLELDEGNKSDHLIMAKVMKKWEEMERSGRKAANNFCERYYLIRGTMYSLRDLKSQFAQYLFEMGFLKDRNYEHRSLNLNSENIAMVKAVICSGLYPNVAIMKRKINTKARSLLLMRTSEDGSVTLHQKSVNTAQQQDFESNFFVYHEKLRSSCIFIFETTMVPPLPLLLFCYDFFWTDTGDKSIIQINKDLKFFCEKEAAKLIVELKLRLDWLLEYKLSHPGHVSWNDETSDIKLLKTLTKLFTTENDGIMGTAKSDSGE